MGLFRVARIFTLICIGDGIAPVDSTVCKGEFIIQANAGACVRHKGPYVRLMISCINSCVSVSVVVWFGEEHSVCLASAY